jgi:hypothetical protein
MDDSPGSDGVRISNGQTSPQTNINDEEPDDRTIVERIGAELKPKWVRINRRLPVSVPVILLGVFIYLTGLIAIASALSPHQAFGFLSATTGALILVQLYHPVGEIEARTLYQRVIYYGVALSFLLIGIQYMLTGTIPR